MSKIALVLCNLGGPDSLDAVKPFLKNLFADPAILPMPKLIRWMLGTYIVNKRLSTAIHNYSLIGGASPLLEQTQAQAEALTARMAARNPDHEYKSFIAMRYWHPMSPETVSAVKEWGPDQVVVLPLYPQYSTTTTESSLLDWQRTAKKQGLTCKHICICCYPTQPGWIQAVAQTVEDALNQFDDLSNVRVVFSAHGLPKSIVDAGDPYPDHIEATVEKVVDVLHRDNLDWILSYQSRVGPQEWIGPSTDETLEKAGAEKKSVVIVPIAFVSEHSETLVELDMEYGELAAEAGVPTYIRTPTVGCDSYFIGGLANLVETALEKSAGKDSWCRYSMDENLPCKLYSHGKCPTCGQ